MKTWCWILPLAFLVMGRGAVVAQESAAEGAAESLGARFEQALTYEAFLALDSVEAKPWRANFERGLVGAEPEIARLRAAPGRWRLLVVAELWCSDSYGSVPYLARLAAESPNLELRILRRAEAADLLAAHQAEGRGEVPLVLVLDEQYRERGAIIEHPSELHTLIQTEKDRSCEDQLKYKVRKWYRENAGRAVVAEVVSIVAAA